MKGSFGLTPSPPHVSTIFIDVFEVDTQRNSPVTSGSNPSFSDLTRRPSLSLVGPDPGPHGMWVRCQDPTSLSPVSVRPCTLVSVSSCPLARSVFTCICTDGRVDPEGEGSWSPCGLPGLTCRGSESPDREQRWNKTGGSWDVSTHTPVELNCPDSGGGNRESQRTHTSNPIPSWFPVASVVVPISMSCLVSIPWLFTDSRVLVVSWTRCPRKIGPTVRLPPYPLFTNLGHPVLTPRRSSTHP